jgi:MFS family permease
VTSHEVGRRPETESCEGRRVGSERRARRAVENDIGGSGRSAAPVGPAIPSSSIGRAFVSLRDHDFRYLSLSTVAIGFGQWGQQIALNWLVFELTGSAIQLGAVAFIGGVVALGITPFGGVIADRYPRRAVIVVATFAGAVQSFAIALLVLTDLVELWHVYAFALASAVTMAINQPARQAYVFDVSTDETLTNAIAMNSIAQNAARVVGPSLAGLLAASSLAAPFIFVAVTRAVGTAATMRMSGGPHRVVERSGQHPVREVVEGFRYLARDRRLAGLLALTALPAVLVYPYVSFMPIFAEEVLGGGSTTYGLLAAMVGVGSVIGLFVLAFAGEVPHRGRYMLAGLLVYLVLVVGFTQSEQLALSLALLVLAGVFNGTQLALNTTLFQRVVRHDMRGRGMAAWQMGRSVSPFGAFPMGVVISYMGVQSGSAVFVLACLAIVALFAIFWRSGREL